MSILASEVGGAAGLAYLLLGPVAAVVVAVMLKVWRGRLVVGPERMEEEERVGPLVWVLGVGFVAWAMTGAVYVTVAKRGQPTTRGGIELSPKEMVVVGAAGHTLGFLVLVGGNVVVRRGGVGRLGFGIGKLPRGAVLAVVGILFVMPMMSLLGIAVVKVYEKVGFRHPMKHDLLQILGERQEAWLRFLIVFTAVVVAPLFEELFFRGHVQTLARRVFAPPERVPYARAHVPEPQTIEYAHGLKPVDVMGRPAPRGMALRVWGAILVTSAAFTIVHAPWTWPMIFVLSVCLGYAYERTGNLWVPIGIHALFNGISTAISMYS